MRAKHFELIGQARIFPWEEFNIQENTLEICGKDLNRSVAQYGATGRFTCQSIISEDISIAKKYEYQLTKGAKMLDSLAEPNNKTTFRRLGINRRNLFMESYASIEAPFFYLNL